MTLFPDKDLVLVSISNGVKVVPGKPDYPWAIVKLADPDTYENLEFTLHRDQIPNLTQLQARTRYRVAIDVTAGQKGNFMSATLMPSGNIASEKKPA